MSSLILHQCSTMRVCSLLKKTPNCLKRQTFLDTEGSVDYHNPPETSMYSDLYRCPGSLTWEFHSGKFSLKE